MQVPNYTPEQKKQFAQSSGTPWEDLEGMDNQTFAATYDPKYKAANPYTAVTQSFDRYDPSLNQPMEALYGKVKSWLPNNRFAGALNESYPQAAGSGALVGAGLSAAINFLKNRLTGDSGGYGTAALAGGALGGIAGAGLHYNRQHWAKQAAFSFGENRDLEDKIMDASGLTVSEKKMLVKAIGKLSDKEKKDLKKSLGTAFGASIGAVVAKFLFSKGLIPMAVGGILGGMAGNRIASSQKRNSLGQFV